jgi:hypothetical protein
MREKVIGKIKNIVFIPEKDDLEVTILITDPKFRKKLLRDLSLSGNLKVEGTQVIFIDGDTNA